jgi:hypothetical protein
MAISDWNERLTAFTTALAALKLDETREGQKKLMAKVMRSVIGAKASGAKAVLGGSKFGGRPHAEAGFVWPTAKNIWKDNTLEPLAFIAQLNLAEMAAQDPTGTLPNRGRILFFMLPEEYDPMSHRAYTHVVPDGPVVEHAPPRGLAAAGGLFKAKSLSFAPTVRFPDPNGGFLSVGYEYEQQFERLQKKHKMATPDIDALLDKPAFSHGKLKRFSPKKDVILLRFFGEALSPESLWFETEIMLVIGREALAQGLLNDARIVMGEST